MMEEETQKLEVPTAFWWRRLHSLSGLLLVLFLLEHLMTNSQAALLLGEDGAGFVRAVNFIHSLPYLPAIELLLIGAPLFIHACWGVNYLLSSKANSWPSNGSRPGLTHYPRNHAYTWQRITSWILLIGIAAHVVQMRFVRYPERASLDHQHLYLVQLQRDNGLDTLADRLGVALYDEEGMGALAARLQQERQAPTKVARDPAIASRLQVQQEDEHRAFLSTLKRSTPLEEGNVIAASHSMGTAILLTVRDVMKHVGICLLYSLFVVAATFHGFNGLWTFCITWGITITENSQRLARRLCIALSTLTTFFGLAAIWGTYWLNLFE